MEAQESSLPETQGDSAQRMYDARASEYDNSWHPAFARRMVGFAQLKPEQHVLDLACGTGLATIPAAQAVGPRGRVVAVDISKGMLQEARNKVQREGLTNVEILNHDITKLDELERFRNERFDAIIMASALVLLTDVDRSRALKTYFNLLKPSGLFVVDVLTPSNEPSGLIFERAAKSLGFTVPYNRGWVKNQTSVEESLKSSGFEIFQLLEVQQTGEATKYADTKDADAILEKHIKGEHARKIIAAAHAHESNSGDDRIRKAFHTEWEAAAVDGKVKMEDKVWVVIAIRR